MAELDWTAEVVGRMHAVKLTGQQLAERCGYTAAYLSQVLNGHKGNEQTKARIMQELEAYEIEALGAVAEEPDHV